METLADGLRRNHGLCAGADKAAGHAVDFKRGTRPGALEHGVVRFAGEDSRTDFRLAIVLFVEGQRLPRLQFGVGGLGTSS